ncbi:MAG: CRISPR system precrRNA processing endoribonuclease RAMP protein Cas6 [Candidatus Scalindua sp.]|nr:CRISPR system precrRNA processing endoribonuclease RAMP protein Cas6 [Candidatus Scalindua sp.]
MKTESIQCVPQKLTISRFQFNLLPLEEIHLPLYKGSTLRGGFGHAFKRVVCIQKGKQCNDCMVKSTCVYSYVFETSPPADTEILRLYKNVPHPFVIEPPLTSQRSFKKDDEITFNLILIGKAIQYLPYFIYTFDELGKIGIGKGKGKFHLKSVTSEIEETGREERSEDSIRNSIIYSGEDKTLHNHFRVMTAKEISHTNNSPSKIEIEFLTPARMIFNERLVAELEFHHMIRTLLRRVSSLSYFHCGELLELDFKALIEQAEEIKCIERDLRWYDWQRYSARQETKMKMGGFIGKVVFEGDLEHFMPLIALGEYVHVGKGTVYGLGKYRVTVNNEE